MAHFGNISDQISIWTRAMWNITCQFRYRFSDRSTALLLLSNFPCAFFSYFLFKASFRIDCVKDNLYSSIGHCKYPLVRG